MHTKKPSKIFILVFLLPFKNFEVVYNIMKSFILKYAPSKSLKYIITYYFTLQAYKLSKQSYYTRSKALFDLQTYGFQEINNRFNMVFNDLSNER